MKEKAKNLLQQCTEVVLSSISPEGYPRACVISKIHTQGLGKIWFSTGTQSTKTVQFQKNPKASVCFWKDGDSVTLLGTISVLTDRHTRERMWQDWFLDHFPGGIDDPDYCILAFSPQEATMWIDGEFKTIQVTEND